MQNKFLSYLFFVIVLCETNFSQAQQYPFWTQYRSNLFMMNPAVAGTRKNFDARLNYRNQWVGFAGAPKTMAASLHGKFFHHGLLGAGGFIFQDVIGPFKYVNMSGAFAYHAKFTDAKLSLGISGSYQSQTYLTSKVTTQFNQDPAVDYSFAEKKRKGNMAFGVLYYNDRFHIGFAANNLLGSTFEYYKKDTTRKAVYAQVIHYNFSVGYNWQDNPNFIWENSLIASFVANTPILIDYSLRLHYKDQFFLGATYRLKTAVAFTAGYTFNHDYQFSYSYDLNINKLRTASAGTHEIKLVFSSNVFENEKRNKNKEFQHQKFQFLL
ncbi:MAG: type IX secretion system membrane protein PorP/SprF [Bacteroidia bacterium]|nr:type IX secretion system membrane protein PorP/SprF [Bacteroidia bacterium]